MVAAALSDSALSPCLVLFLLAGCGGDDRSMPSVPLGGEPAVPDLEHGPGAAGDVDGDGVPDADDNCPSVANADQRTACTYGGPPPLSGDVVADGVARIDWHRHRAGLGPVVSDADLDHGCQVHLDYLVQLSAERGAPVLSHEEDLSRPYASEEGNQAGVDSVLSFGRPDIASAIDGWINTLYHRLPLLHPGLTRVGVAFRDGFACVQYRPGTDAGAVAPHPIFYPPPDIDVMGLTFGGSESPCPTADDPLGGGSCPGSAMIPSLGLHGLGSIDDVTATYVNLDTGEPVELFRTYWDGGPSPHERAGYLAGSVAAVPAPGSALDSAGYEVTVQATVAGQARTYRWRFRTVPQIDGSTPCDALGAHRDIASAYPVTSGRINGRFCGEEDFYEILGSGLIKVEIHSDPRVADLDLVAYYPDGREFAHTAGLFVVDWLEVDPGMIVKVTGPPDAEAPYLLIIP